jgi:hypothetical protein
MAEPNVSSLVLKLLGPSDHVCNGGTWKIPVPRRPGAPRRSFQCCTARQAKFPVGNHTGFLSKKSREKSGNFELCKKVAACTNNKDIFLTILCYHVWDGHLQYLADKDSEEVLPRQSAEEWLTRNDSISCELCIQYTVLQAILYGRKKHQSLI